MANYIAFDTETDLIGPGNLAPDLICSTFYDLQTKDVAIIGHLDRDDTLATYRALLEDPDTHLIGQNVAYDLSIISRYEPTLLPLIWQALYADRIHDTMLREMLINLTVSGNIDVVEDGGMNRKIFYGLDALVKDYLGIDIKEAKEATDSARLTYSIVKEYPVEQWPEHYRNYAMDDAKYTGLVFLEQEIRRKKVIESTGYDPFTQATFRTRVHFALRLLELQGNLLDPERVLAVTKEFEDLYNAPELVQPLVEAGIVIPALPPQPYAKGTKEHLETCRGHKSHLDFKKGKKVECNCPVKMKEATKASTSIITLHDRIWKLALDGKCEAWAAKATLANLKQEGIKDDFIEGMHQIKTEAVVEALRQLAADSDKPPAEGYDRCLPDKWKLKANKEWMANFQDCDPVIAKYAERKRIEKIVTSYLPNMYGAIPGYPAPATEEEQASKYYGKAPAERIHACFSPLKRTGRTSSYASKLYPSWNGQQVDPRIRPCVIPAPGRVLFSIDYSGMELCTAAQVCLNLFGHSVLADKINAGVDTHAFLGAQIAYKLDDTFKEAADAAEGFEDEKDARFSILQQIGELLSNEPCSSPQFQLIKEGATWGDFFKHYRKFAKPTGLGYPGGLGPRTFVAYAKATYGVTVDLKTAELLRDVFFDTYPEMKQYLNYVNKECWDRINEPDFVEDDEGKFSKRTYYAYDTPLGLHRAKCDYCACANGQALQGISADGALTALAAVMKECSVGSLAGSVWPALFIHDEVAGEILDDEYTTERLAKVASIMEEQFRVVTPDIVSKAVACTMRRWYKAAEPVWENGKLIPWEPEAVEEEDNTEEIEIEELTGEE